MIYAYLRYSNFKFLFDRFASDEIKKHFVDEYNSSRRKKFCEMVAKGFPENDTYIVDFTDKDYNLSDRLPLVDLLLPIDYSSTSNLNTLDSYITSIISEEIRYEDSIIKGKEDVIIKAIEDKKDDLCNSIPTILIIKYNNLEVKSSSGFTKNLGDLYAFLYVTNLSIRMFACRPNISIKEASIGFVHPHVSVSSFTVVDRYLSRNKEQVYYDGLSNYNNIGNVCLGDSDLFNYLVQYSSSSSNPSDSDDEMLSILVSGELERIFSSENSSGNNYPYMYMKNVYSENGEEGDDNKFNIVRLIYGRNFNDNVVFNDIAIDLYCRNRIHFSHKSYDISVTDSTLYIMSECTKSFISYARTMSALGDNYLCNTMKSFFRKYKTDGFNVYTISDENNEIIRRINMFNNVGMFKFKERIVNLSIDYNSDFNSSGEIKLISHEYCESIMDCLLKMEIAKTNEGIKVGNILITNYY